MGAYRVPPHWQADRFFKYGEEYVCHTKGRWARQKLIYEPWQRAFWYEALECDPVTGLRIYNEVGLGLPRKNGKSVMASHLGLFFLDPLGEGENEPEVLVAAAAKGQAGIVMGQSVAMALQSPELSERFRSTKYRIDCPYNGGVMRSVSAAAALQHGTSPSLGLIDEMHAHSDDGALYTALTTGGGAREQGLTFWFSAAGAAGEGILADLYESMFSGVGKLEVLNDGCLLIYRDKVNGTLIYWYGAPKDADIADPAIWRLCNPISYLQDLKYLTKQYANLGARGALGEWRRYHLNQFNATEDTWLKSGTWAATVGDAPLDAALPIGVGIDRDPDGEQIGVVVAQKQGDRVVTRAQLFGPESTGMASTEAVRVALRELRLTYPLPQTAEEKTRRPIPGPAYGFDPASLPDFADALNQEGLNMVEMSMTPAVMAPPSMMTYELITTGRLVHTADPIFAEHVANTTATLTDRGMKVLRSKNSARPNVLGVALPKAVALALQDAPKPFVRRPRRAVGF
jgi:phage terminase large subunit-like protein